VIIDAKFTPYQTVHAPRGTVRMVKQIGDGVWRDAEKMEGEINECGLRFQTPSHNVEFEIT
jgi:hypothetical protein